MSDLDVTWDMLLGGRVRLAQPRRGLRAAIDPVLLAAGVPARSGDHVLEAGCGTGAAFLCLAARVPSLTIVAVERETSLAALARRNAAENGLQGRATVLTADIADAALDRLEGSVAHAFANPPWWVGGTRPPDPLRSTATHAEGTDLTAWARFLARSVRRGGTVSLLLPAARLHAALTAMADADCGNPLVLPFWPRAGLAAKRVLVQGRRGRDGPLVLATGLALHGAGQGYTDAAEAVLRYGAGLTTGR